MLTIMNKTWKLDIVIIRPVLDSSFKTELSMLLLVICVNLIFCLSIHTSKLLSVNQIRKLLLLFAKPYNQSNPNWQLQKKNQLDKVKGLDWSCVGGEQSDLLRLLTEGKKLSLKITRPNEGQINVKKIIEIHR